MAGEQTQSLIFYIMKCPPAKKCGRNMRTPNVNKAHETAEEKAADEKGGVSGPVTARRGFN